MGTAPGDGPREEADPNAPEPVAGGLVREVHPSERYGPLVVRRYVRADGRALILFERARVEETGT